MMNKILLVISLAFISCLTQAQTCNEDILSTAPNSLYSINGDGTVTDSKTGLIWMRCSLGQAWDSSSCVGTTLTHSWSEALTAGNAQVFAGKTDWRLPNIKELNSLIDYKCIASSINETVFPMTISDYYWTASGIGTSSWAVSFHNGTDASYLKSIKWSVRLVRGGN